MEQYIKKSAIVAELEKQVKRLEDAFNNPSFASYEANLIAKGRYRKLKDILSFLDTLEVKEVEEKQLLQKAISVYGIEAQTDMAIEEMGELIVAINHYRRGRVGMDAVQEEIADVMIAMKQLAMIYGESGVDEFITKKSQRLEQRLKDK